MIAWLWKLIVGDFNTYRCKHKWITVHKSQIMYKGQCIGTLYTQVCDHCGELKDHQSEARFLE